MKRKMKKRMKWWSVLLTIALCFSLIPVYSVSAESESQETLPGVRTYISRSLLQDSWFYMYVDAWDLKDVGAMEFSIPYDTDIFEMQEADAVGLLEDAMVDIKKDEGSIRVSAMSLDGINGSGSMLRIYGHVKADAVVGDYTLKVLLGKWYDTQMKEIDVQKETSTFSVRESSRQASVQMGMNVDSGQYGVKRADRIRIRCWCSKPGKLAGGSVVFSYDPEALKLIKVEPKEEIKGQNVIYTINDSVPGNLKASFLCDQAITEQDFLNLFDLEFQVIGNRDGYVEIAGMMEGLVSEELQSMTGQSTRVSLYQSAVEETDENNKMWLEPEKSRNADEMKFALKAISDQKVAAGDFTVTYPSGYLTCTDVEVDGSVSSQGGYIVTNEKIDRGQISFSYVNPAGVSGEQTLLHLTFQKPVDLSNDLELAMTGKNVVDKDFKNVKLSYVPYKIYCSDINATETPDPSGMPGVSEIPAVSGTPDPGEKPVTSEKPSVSGTPNPGETLNPGGTPGTSEKPSVSGTPNPGGTPGTSEKPSASGTPGASGIPSVSGTPNPGETPGAGENPSVSEFPQPTGSSPSTDRSQGTPSVASPSASPGEDSGQKGGKGNTTGDDVDSIGYTHTSGSVSYCIVKKADGGEGEVFVSALKNKKLTSVVIPKKIKIGKKTYKVTGIAKNAFKNCKSLKKITIKTKTLKKVGKNAIKGIYKKAKIICPKKKKVYTKKYKKLFKKNTGYRKTMKIK